MPTKSARVASPPSESSASPQRPAAATAASRPASAVSSRTIWTGGPGASSTSGAGGGAASLVVGDAAAGVPSGWSSFSWVMIRKNSSSLNRARIAVRSGWRRRSSSTVTGRGMSQRRVTSWCETRTVSRAASSASPFFPFTSAAWASTFSSDPNRLTSSAAPLGPMPGTPGMLSMLSPCRASTSATFSGGTPNFSRTSGGPMNRLRMVSSMKTRSPTTCMRSLSPEHMTTFMPASDARQASVAMTSSASTAGTITLGMPKVSTTRCSSSTCAARSGGMGGRPAL
jgi:hypothetical protein